ncbi:peroxisomal coenzyme A diphosphatase NUDT7 isoform X2 [Pristis pectinata]|uniref:peroxisomal coenzyme A diphosphatase NUDT7 isoform X2 n=1 Tax=Pristis pectinata TaxID=685728 RepID=UPI00223E4B49|nr:peroxisomal coenzyme A diphosphatase NUDT7 isoform X2 [Pristis pectinata]
MDTAARVWGLGRSVSLVLTGTIRRNFSAQTSGEVHIANVLKSKFPQASLVKVVDISGGCGAMYEVHVESVEFKGKRLVQQHQMINQVVREAQCGIPGCGDVLPEREGALREESALPHGESPLARRLLAPVRRRRRSGGAMAEYQPARTSIKEKAKHALKLYDIGNKYSDLTLPRASVLVPLLIKNEELHVLLTVRSMQEDILVTPVVAFISDTFRPQPNASEVSDVFILPMHHFLKSEEHSSTPYDRGMLLHFFTFKDRQLHKSFTIWGLTAQICIIVGYLALGQKPLFKVDFDIDNPMASMDKYLMAKYATSKL